MEISRILQPRVSTLNDIEEMVDFFDTLPAYDNAMYTHKKMKTNAEIALSSLKAARTVLACLPQWTEAAIHDALMEEIGRQGIKNGQMLWPVRTALSGKQFTPGGAIEIAHILGKEETLRRMDLGIEQLSRQDQTA